MAIIKLGPDNFDQLNLVTHPSRSFSSSSIRGITGSVFVYAERSPIEKDVQYTLATWKTPFGQTHASAGDKSLVFSTIELIQNMNDAKNKVALGAETNISGAVTAYLDQAAMLPISQRKLQKKMMLRRTTTPRFTASSSIKTIIKKKLFEILCA